jgi:hypothetical protein
MDPHNDVSGDRLQIPAPRQTKLYRFARLIRNPSERHRATYPSSRSVEIWSPDSLHVWRRLGTPLAIPMMQRFPLCCASTQSGGLSIMPRP